MVEQERWALVTGASSGLGREFARQLARRGYDLVVVARRRERLETLAAQVAAEVGRRVEVVVADLADPGAAAVVHGALSERGVVVDLVINNAGLGTDADVIDTDPALLDRLLQVNVVALTALTRLVAADMVARGRGVVVNVASLAAVMPVPHMAVYAASKAFVTSFTQALDTELRGSGVAAVVVLPSATRTEFAASGGKVPGPESMHADPVAVVEEVLDALERPRLPRVIVPGRVNAALAPVLARLPRRLVLGLVERAMRVA